MEPRIVNADPTYPPATLIEPTTLGYLHVAATVRPGPIPFALPNGKRAMLLAALKEHARKLEAHEEVVRATVFRAVVLPPANRTSGYLRERGSSIRVPRFDVVVLIETTSPETAPQVKTAPAYDALMTTLSAGAQATHVIAARNAKRIADVERKPRGLFLFNYFVADDTEVALALWDHLAGWYAVETGLDNSVVLMPLEGEPSDYAFINFARWDESLPRFLWSQLAKKSFRSYVLANLDANRVGSMPVLYRLA